MKTRLNKVQRVIGYTSLALVVLTGAALFIWPLVTLQVVAVGCLLLAGIYIWQNGI